MKTNIKLTNDILPSHATHPGVLIADELKRRRMKQIQLADAMDITQNVLSELTLGKRKITPKIALKLEKALEIDAVYLMRLQVRYEIDTLRIIQRYEKLRSELIKERRKVLKKKFLNKPELKNV